MKIRDLQFGPLSKDEVLTLTVLLWLTETRPEIGEMGQGFFASRRWDSIKGDSLLQAKTLFEEFEAEFNDDNIDNECAYKQINRESR